VPSIENWVLGASISAVLLASCNSGNVGEGPHAPVITSQPSDQSAQVGQAATFSVVATGDPAPAYQWRRGGQDSDGAMQSSYTTPAVGLADDGAVFSVVVSNSEGSVTSEDASLTVSPPSDTLPGDELAPWEGGPAYYAQWENGPSTDPAFFPIAVWLQEPTAATATRYRDIGVNTHVGLWAGPTEDQLSAVAGLAATTVCDQNPVGLASANRGVIKAWMQQDEPDNAQNGTEDPVPTADVIGIYDTLVAADPTRPVYLNLGQGVASDAWYGRGHRTNHPEDYLEYARGGDILSFDTYPMNVFPSDPADPDWKKAFCDTVAQNIWYVAEGVDRLREWTSYEKPVWAWIETTNIDGHAGFALTPELTRAEVWMAIIHGARGIGYFCHQFNPDFIEAGLLADPAMTAGVHAVNDRILGLAPVLNTPSVANGVGTASSEPAIPVDTMVKRADGFTYLFAVSMRPGTTTATFTLRGFSSDQAVEVLGEDRSLETAAGVFQDGFSDYAVHIYRIANPM